MEKKGKYTLLTVEEFDQWLNGTKFNRVIKVIQNHHTYIPAYEHFKGGNHFALLKGMESSHIERGFAEIAQNLTTFPDGTVALCRAFENIPAGIKGANRAGICIEHVGNFDKGRDAMNAAHREAIVRVNALLCREFGLVPTTDAIIYHHWYDLNTGLRTNGTGSTKSCPGTAFFSGNTVEAAATNFIPLVAAALSKLTTQSSNVIPLMSMTAEVTASNLNVRSGKGTSFPVIKALRQGIMVNVYEERDGWCRIHPTEQHWVFGRYLRMKEYNAVSP